MFHQTTPIREVYHTAICSCMECQYERNVVTQPISRLKSKQSLRNNREEYTETLVSESNAQTILSRLHLGRTLEIVDMISGFNEAFERSITYIVLLDGKLVECTMSA